MPKFSLLYTSVRPHCILDRCRAWLDSAKEPGLVEIVICTEITDVASCTAAAEAACDLKHAEIKRVIQRDPNGDCVKGWNAAAAFSTAPIMVQISDDFNMPNHWDEKLLALSCGHGEPWWLHEHAVHVNDAYIAQVMTLAIITATRYHKQGYFYYPGYRSMFCDTELTDVAYRDGIVIDARKTLTFEHAHYDRQARAKDTADAKHCSSERWQTGEALYRHRKARNFPNDLLQRVNATLAP